MPSEPIPWDRKEYFKMRKEERADLVGYEDSCEVTRRGSSFPRKRLVDENGVSVLKAARLDHDLSQLREKILEDARLDQCKHQKFSGSSVFDEESCGKDSQVFGGPKELTPDSSASILAEKSCSAFHNVSVGLSHREATSMLTKRAFEGDMDQKFADSLQHSSNHGHTDNSVGLAHNPIRWMRSGSLSSHESGLSYSISSKSMSANFSNKVEAHKQNMNSWQSASGDTVSCVTPTTPSEETSPWKRPRLKWGEGLAKFEKKSLVPDDRPNKSETFSCTSAQLSECVSPATPSAACSSFPGSEDKPFTKAVAVSNGNDSFQKLVSETLKHLEVVPFKLEKADLSIINDAVPSLIEMINFDKKCSKNFGSTSISVMNKLLLLKSELLKAVDVTEYEVDLLENELESFNNESGHDDSQCLTSDSPAIKHINESGQMTLIASAVSNKPAMLFHEITDIVDSGNSEAMKADMGSAGSVTSKLVEHPSSESDAVSGVINNGEVVFELAASSSPQEAHKSSQITSHAGISDSGLHMAVAVDDIVVDSIWDSNRDFANKAAEDLNIVYPVAKNIKGSSSDVCSDDIFFRELFVRKKKALRFKEQAAALKWRAMHIIQKDNMRFFSVRNHCSNGQKRLEIFSQTALNNRPSVRSKSLHVKKSSLNMSKLLSSSHLKPCRSFLKMPALILDDDEKRTCIFLSSNGLVEDPYGAEKERSMINAWSSEEIDIFWEKLASHGKDFRKIACFLDHKSTADCIQFYYKNHKSQSFTKKGKQQDRIKIDKNSTYLVTPAKQWDRVVDTASLDILGAASELVARNSERKENKKLNSCGLLLHGVGHTRPPRKDVLYSQRTIDFRVAGHEIRTPDNEMLPGACGSVSSEAVSSCISSSVNQVKGHCSGTHKTFSILSKPPSIPEDILIDEETCSDENSCELDVGYWTDVEKFVFVRAVQSYGKDFCMISRCIQTKTKDQCKSFYSKACKRLGLDIILPDNDDEHQSGINDSNGDQSAPILTSIQEAVPYIEDRKVSQRIHEDVSVSVSVTSNLDSLSPDAGMTSHVCLDKLEDIEGNFDKPHADPKIECQLMDKSAFNPHMACVGSKPAMSNDNDNMAFPRKYSESTNNSVVDSPSLSFSVPYLRSLAQLGKQKRGSIESPLLQYHFGENGMSVDYIQNKVSCTSEDHGTLKVPCQRHADNQPFVGIPAAYPRQMYVSKGPVRVATSQNRLAFRTSCGLLNPTQQHNAGFRAPEISFARNSIGEMGRYFQEAHYPVNHVMQQTHLPSNQFYFSQTYKKNLENKESAWNMNFEDSTISRESYLESENGLPSYAIIPQTGYLQRCPSLNSNPLVTKLSYFKPSSHSSSNQNINPVRPEKQRNQTNLKLFGQVLIPSTAPETLSLEDTELTQLSQMKGTPPRPTT